MDKCHRK